jgi:hypothetical protein
MSSSVAGACLDAEMILALNQQPVESRAACSIRVSTRAFERIQRIVRIG